MDKKSQLLELLKQKKKEQELSTPKGFLGEKLDKVHEAVKNIPKTEIPQYPAFPAFPEFPKSMEMTFKGLQTITLKGDRGEKGDKGDSPTEKELLRLIKPLIPAPIHGRDGFTPMKGVDYFDGVDGKDGLNGSPDTAEDIRNKLELLREDDRLDLSSIRGVDTLKNDILRLVNNQIISLDTFRAFGVKVDGVKIGNANELNFKTGSNTTILGVNNSQQGIDITISSSGGGGTPGGSNTQLQYNNNGSFGGVTGATTDGAKVTFSTGGLVANDLTCATSAGYTIHNSSNTDVALFGAGGGQNSTFYGGVKMDFLTASKVVFTDASKNLTSTGPGTSSQFIKGDGSLDSSTYLTGNQSISLSGAVSGTGTTSIVTTLANSIVGISNLSATGTPSSSTYLRGDNTWATITGTGTVTSISNSDGTITLSPSPITTTGTVSINLAHANTWTGVATFSPAARTSGSASYLTINAAADTGITAATESIGINHAGATRTWADGTVATQREYYFGAPTYNKTTTAATFTKAATVAISGAPTAGTGVTITNAYALWVQGGISEFDGNILQNAAYARFGNALPFAALSTGTETWGNDNTVNGVQVGVGNRNTGTSAYTGFFLNNDLASDGLVDHYAFIGLNSSGYTDTTFGTAFAVANQLNFQNTDGPIAYVTNKTGTTGAHQWYAGGAATSNLVMQLTNTALTLSVPLIEAENAQSGTTYTFVLTDANGMVTSNSASATTFTVPPNSSVAYPIGTRIDVLQIGAGKLTIAAGAGVTINSQNSNKSMATQYVGATLWKQGTNTWYLIGNLIA